MKYPFLKKMDIFHIIKTLVCPNEICESVEDIDTDMLLQKGIETVYLDIDNTYRHPELVKVAKFNQSTRKDKCADFSWLL